MSDLYQYHQKYSGSKKIKYSREEIKVLEKMRRSDFANFQRVLLLLWSRLEFRSRSTLSIHQELDQVKETFVSDIRGVVPGGAKSAMAPLDFGRSVNPISTRGADYAHHSTTVLTMLKYVPAALRRGQKLAKFADG